VVKESPEWAKYQKALLKLDTAPNISNADDGSDYDQLTQLVNTAGDRAAQQETKSERRNAFVKVCDAVLSTLSALNGPGAAATALNPYAAVAWGWMIFVKQLRASNGKLSASTLKHVLVLKNSSHRSTRT
jgi:hypothetical protein